MYKLAPFYCQDKIEICFVNVDDSESVDLVVTGFLEDHCINHCLPPGKRVSGMEAVIYDGQYGASDEDLFCLEGSFAWFCLLHGGWEECEEYLVIVPCNGRGVDRMVTLLSFCSRSLSFVQIHCSICSMARDQMWLLTCMYREGLDILVLSLSCQVGDVH